MMVLDKEDGRWRAGGRRPAPPRPPPRRAGAHAGTRARTRRAVPGLPGAGGAPGAGPGAGAARWGRGRGEGACWLAGGWWGGRVQAPVPSDLGAVALRARRLVFAAAPLTAAISLALCLAPAG